MIPAWSYSDKTFVYRNGYHWVAYIKHDASDYFGSWREAFDYAFSNTPIPVKVTS